MLSLRCLLDTEVELSSKQWGLCAWSLGFLEFRPEDKKHLESRHLYIILKDILTRATDLANREHPVKLSFRKANNF